MARAQGARARMALAFETTYGTPPASGFTRMPFASTTLGAEQPLLNSELLGYGRDPLAPIKDAVTADGDVVVPIDAEAFGFWLKAAFSDPTTTGAGLQGNTVLDMVEAVNGMGALDFTAEALRRAEQLPPALGALVIGGLVAVANNLVNNLPLGLIAGSTLTATHTTGLLANAVLIGVDLGPNLSVTGSLATILWLSALRREHLDVGFGDFLKLGALVMPIALVLALGGAILMSLVLPAH